MSERGRLRWRCRRGTQELDRLLIGFLEQQGGQLNAGELAAFDGLLDNEDDDLVDWLINAQGEPEDETSRALVRRIRDHALV